MKIKHILNGLLAALLLATASCSTDEQVKNEGDGSEVNADGTRTIKFKLEGLTLASEKNGTKAGSSTIATDEENVVDDLRLALFTNPSSSSFDKTTDQEIWYYSKDNLDAPDGVNKLLLTQDGKNLTGVIKTKLTGNISAYLLTNGVTFRKANGSALTLPEFPDQIYDLIKVGSNDGIIVRKETSGAYGATLLDFANTQITTPLPMSTTSVINTGISSSLSFKLERAVARFDLQNRIEKLRILSITPKNAPIAISRRSGRIDQMKPVPVYTGTDYAGDEALAAQTAVPLFYTLPSQLDDARMQPMTFDVKAMLRAADGTWTEKIYNLQLTREGKQLAIVQNTRYTLSFTDATDQTLTASIFISDWSNGENLDGEIGNTKVAPIVKLDNGITSDQNIAVITSTGVTIPVTNYTTDIETGASNENNVGTHLAFDILSTDGNLDHVWLKQPDVSPYALNGRTLNCSFEKDAGYSLDEYPAQIVRIKNLANPTQYAMVRVVNWVTNGAGNDIYGNDGDTQATAYQIRTTDDLLAFMRTESNFQNKYISLENDLDLSEYVFEKGVTGRPGYDLRCNFLGNHHTIRNFKLERTITTNAEGVGFFNAGFTGVLMDLSVEGNINVSLEGVSSGSGDNQYLIGGICAGGNGPLIHCNNHIDITVNSTSTILTCIGGLSGYAVELPIIGCTNTGIIRSNKGYIGGLVGLMLNDTQNTNIVGCYNNGTIISEGTSIAGGIIGGIHNKDKVYIQNNYNSQLITGNGTGQRGGIVGAVLDNLFAPISLDQIVVAAPVLCFYSQPVAPYSMSWGGTAIEATKMQEETFVFKLNDFSALPATNRDFTAAMKSSLTGNYIYNVNGYPGIRKLTQEEMTAILTP